MTTLATIRQAMTAFLAEAGIEALSAWPKEVWKGRKTPVAVVQVTRPWRSPAVWPLESRWRPSRT